MDKGTEYVEKDYITSQVAIMLDMAIPTVRKYCMALESKGYTFDKKQGTGQHQSRVFYESDVSALRYLKDIRNDTGITVDKASSIVIEELGKGRSEAIRPVTRTDIQEDEQYSKEYDELKELIHKQGEAIDNQTALIKQLTDKLDRQQQYIDESLNRRDQLLLQTLEEKQDKKKGFFERLFNKNE